MLGSDYQKDKALKKKKGISPIMQAWSVMVSSRTQEIQII